MTARTPDTLSNSCPRCGSPAEYPDCENCGHDFTGGATGRLDAPPTVFLQTLFSDKAADAWPLVTGFAEDPKDAPPSAWQGVAVNGQIPPCLAPGHNWYTAPALFKRGVDGRIARDKEHAAGVYAIVLDDIGTNGKTDPEEIPLPPTWELETSPDNAQMGYRLREAVRVDEAAALLADIRARGLADRNGSNPVRWFRLPGGTNTKGDAVELHGEPFHCVLNIWEPSRQYSIEEIREGLRLRGTLQATEKPRAPTPDQMVKDWQVPARKLAWDAARRTHDEPQLGRHAEIYAMGCRAARDGLPEDALDPILNEFTAHMRPTDTSGVVSGINWGNERKALRDGYAEGRKDRARLTQSDVSGLLVAAGAPTQSKAPLAPEPEGGGTPPAESGPLFAPAEVPDLPAQADDGFPEPAPAVLEVSGAARVLLEHYLITSRYPQPVFGLAAALCTCATAMGRRYRFRGSAPNLYVVICGPTGCGKEEPQRLAESALVAAGMGRRIGPGGIASGAGIEDHMLAQPETLWCLDELGKMLAALTVDRGRQADIMGVLMRLYSASASTYRGRALAGAGAGEVREIEAPAATVFGASTPDAMRAALTGSDAESGFIGRLLFFPTNNGRPTRHNPQVDLKSIPTEFADWAGRLEWQRQGNLADLNLATPAVPVSTCNVGAEQDAEYVLDEHADRCDETLRLTLSAATRSGVVRSAETAAKLSLSAAVSDDPGAPIVREKHARWAVAASAYLASVFEMSFADRIGGSPHFDDLMRLRDIVFRARDYTNDRFRMATKRGLMPRRYLMKLARMRAREVDELIKTLQETGEIQSGLAVRDPHKFEGLVYWPGEMYGDAYRALKDPTMPPAVGAR